MLVALLHLLFYFKIHARGGNGFLFLIGGTPLAFKEVQGAAGALFQILVLPQPAFLNWLKRMTAVTTAVSIFKRKERAAVASSSILKRKEEKSHCHQHNCLPQPPQ